MAPSRGARSLTRDGPVLVTGAAGFIGRWLVPALLARGHAVAAADRPGAHAPPGATRHEVDLRDPAATSELVRRVTPAAVVHLAAVAFPRDAETEFDHALAMNYAAVDHLCAALECFAPGARLLFASTGEVYGRRPLGAPPAREGDPLRPTNTYAATKAAAETRLVRACARGQDVVRVRAFNTSGPGRPAEYVESSFARQLAELERRGGGVLEVGNLAPVRDWNDVRDVAAAYALLLEQGQPGGVYNVASGEGRPVRWVLDTLLARARCSVEVAVSRERFEPAAPDAVALVGDPSRLRALGWSAAHRFEDTLVELLDTWRAASAKASVPGAR